MIPAPWFVRNAGHEAQRARGIQPLYDHSTPEEDDRGHASGILHPSRAAEAEKAASRLPDIVQSRATAYDQGEPSSSKNPAGVSRVPMIDAETEQSYYHVPNLEDFDTLDNNNDQGSTPQIEEWDCSDGSQSSTPVASPTLENGRMTINLQFGRDPNVAVNINQNNKEVPEAANTAMPTSPSLAALRSMMTGGRRIGK
ncbi:hypothetical protein FQN49_002222 [Arthroderma sp. PD_2]|nr:hypothetical protein FQN49_002222 [Arthroderma sp. PD_2]